MKKFIPLLVILVFLWSCQTKPSADNQSDPDPINFSLSELWATDTIMKTPESVLYDAKRGVLYVANMNRTEEGDDTGFISRLNTDGTVIDLHWIDGLNEPRGMGIHGDLLFATDMNRLLVIDIEKGEVQKMVPVDGSVFLNDLSIAEDGTIYFSDSRANKVQAYKDGEITDWIPEIEGPNGLFDEGEEMLVGGQGAEEVRLVNKATGEYKVLASGVRVDGIEYTGIDDYYIVSEWKGVIHMIGNDTIQKLLDTEAEKKNTADIGYNMEKKIVYVPTFFDNRVVAYQLKMEE
jgi:DNA-binding beta-propeller fold protein YncE